MGPRFTAALLAVAIAAAGVALLSPPAFADGDPASDVLIGQQVFLPYFASVSPTIAQKLAGLLADSKQKGFPLKVAVIAGRRDLGSVPSLFGSPQRYADFLGREDYYFFRDELLVVMPQGYGLYKDKGLPAADRSAVARLAKPASASGDALANAAINAVDALASRRGMTLAAAGGSSSSSQTRDRIEIIGGVVLLSALAIGVRFLVRRREAV